MMDFYLYSPVFFFAVNTPEWMFHDGFGWFWWKAYNFVLLLPVSICRRRNGVRADNHFVLRSVTRCVRLNNGNQVYGDWHGSVGLALFATFADRENSSVLNFIFNWTQSRFFDVLAKWRCKSKDSLEKYIWSSAHLVQVFFPMSHEST